MQTLGFAAILLLMAPPQIPSPPVSAVVDMLGGAPGDSRFDQWKSSWKINYFSKVVLCRPKGHPDSHRGYYEGECRASAAQKTVAALLDTVNRSPESIRTRFEQSKAQLFAVLSPALYGSTGAKQTVKALRLAYEYAARTPKQRARLTHVREGVRALMRDPSQRTSAYGWNWAEHYEKAYPDFRAPKGINGPWLLSFWARRLSEGNIDVVAAILTEIDAHYADSAPPKPAAP